MIPTLRPLAVLLIVAVYADSKVNASTLPPISNAYKTDYARVVSTKPIYSSTQVQTPIKSCTQILEPTPKNTHTHKSNTVPLIGAITGGGIGNALGHNKTNKRVGTALGAALGLSIAKDIQNTNQHSNNTATSTYITKCTTHYKTTYQSSITGYEVRYLYQGHYYSSTLDYKPQKRLKVHVVVVPAK